jgi:hypothetical protein
MKFLPKNVFFEEDNSRALITASVSASFDFFSYKDWKKNPITMPL